MFFSLLRFAIFQQVKYMVNSPYSHISFIYSTFEHVLIIHSSSISLKCLNKVSNLKLSTVQVVEQLLELSSIVG